MNLSPHFSLAEMTRSEAATRKGFDNTPNQEQTENLKALCANILEPIRAAVGKPIRVNSGFRGEKANASIGGSKTSQHCKGEAADIEVDGFDNLAMAKKIIELKLPFDQMIVEGYDAKSGDPNSGWIHVSHKRSGAQRGEVLTATFIKGKASYSSGLPK